MYGRALISVPVEQELAALEVLKSDGIDCRGAWTTRDEAKRFVAVTYQRHYDLSTMRLLAHPDSMVEHEVRRAADEWRNELARLVVEALV